MQTTKSTSMDVLFCFGAARRIPQLEQRTRSANLSCLPARPALLHGRGAQAGDARRIDQQAGGVALA